MSAACVPRNATVMFALRTMLIACRNLQIISFFKPLRFSDNEELNTETRVCRTNFGMDMFTSIIYQTRSKPVRCIFVCLFKKLIVLRLWPVE